MRKVREQKLLQCKDVSGIEIECIRRDHHTDHPKTTGLEVDRKMVSKTAN